MSRGYDGDRFGEAAAKRLEASTSPVDLAVLDMIGEAEGHGRGWVLGLRPDSGPEVSKVMGELRQLAAAGEGDAEQLVALADVLQSSLAASGCRVAVEQTLPPVDEYQRLVNGRKHEINDVESFVMFAGRYGDAEKSLVLVDDSQAVVVIDEQVERGEREIITLPFGRTPEFQAWDGVVGKCLGHKSLLKFLVFHLHTMDSPELLESMRRATVNATIDNESDIQQDAKTLSVRIHTRAGEELASFPKEVVVRVPVLQEDVLEESAWMKAKMRLQIDLPDKPEEAVGFTLICSEWPMLVRKRTQKIVDELRASLKGWTVLRGSHKTFPRQLGRDED